MCSKSIVHEKVPEIYGYVRANVIIQAAIFTKIKDEETDVSVLSCFEPNGL
jgi:hypothetical protein